MLNEKTLKLLKKHITNNKIVFTDKSTTVAIDLSYDQVRRLLSYEYGKVSTKDFEEKLTELLNTVLKDAIDEIKNQEDSGHSINP